jgi:hypothetical protein
MKSLPQLKISRGESLYSYSLSIELASGMAVEVWQTGVYTNTLLAQQVHQKR